MKSIIPENIKEILLTLDILYNCESYVVGGACRDYLLGRNVSDFDIVTKATPEEIFTLFPKAITAGNSFLVSIVDGIEVATYRKDRTEDAVVAKTLQEDVQRRDFTINAIAYDYDKDSFIDYTGGLDDIQNRTLRFVGDAEARIVEDPVRILRGIRFAAKYNLTIEKESFFAMMIHRKLILDIPKERIQKEVI